MRFFFFLLAGLLCLTAPCAAADRAVNPDALQGVWSSPDCTMADSVWVISKYFFIHTGPGEITVRPVQTWRQEETNGDRYFSFAAGRDKTGLINLTNDGLMRIARTAATEGGSLSAPSCSITARRWASVRSTASFCSTMRLKIVPA